MELLHIIRESLVRSGATLLLLVAIILPIMILLEYLTYYNLLKRLSSYFEPLTRCVDLPPEAAFPLFIGLFVGLFYGAAVIIEYGNRRILEKRDLLLLGIFTAICHSIVEDNLIFAALGANLYVLFFVRLLIAFAITRTAAYFIPRSS